jgi:hypothetical protein
MENDLAIPISKDPDPVGNWLPQGMRFPHDPSVTVENGK